MDRLNRYFKREKKKNKNKLMPHVIRPAVASGESLAAGSAHSGPSLPSHPGTSIDPAVAEQDAVEAGTSSSLNAAQQPRLELYIERGELDTGISRTQSLPDTTISKHVHFTCVHYSLSVLDKAPETVPEVAYRPSANEAVTGDGTAPSDLRAQPEDSDTDITSNKAGKPEISAICSTMKYCISEPIQGEITLSGEEAPSKVESSQSAKELAKSAAKLALKTVKEVSDAFPPLKFVAAGLSLIVENAEVCDRLILLHILTAHVTTHVVSERQSKGCGELMHANQ
jgi:hypothetical protein